MASDEKYLLIHKDGGVVTSQLLEKMEKFFRGAVKDIMNGVEFKRKEKEPESGEIILGPYPASTCDTITQTWSANVCDIFV